MTMFHDKSVAEVAAALATDPSTGLRAAEAALRLARDGRNELRAAESVSPLTIFARQFGSVVVWVLIGAAGLAIALGEIVDGAAIVAIIALNALFGFFQEFRAERAVAALARLTAPRAKVVRDGHAAVVAAAEVVAGDVLLLEGGDLVAADARLVEASMLRVDEAPLTGESQPVGKREELLAAETALADRRNMVFLGTSVAAGSGRAVVVATGMATEVGHIATLLESASRDATPLQRRLDRVGSRLLWTCLAIVLLVFVLGLLRDTPRLELLLSAVSLAVAAIPEGLPAVVTVALALGVQRMARRNALVRRLPSVETLGSAQVVCTDKTGTLTVGEMTLRKIVTAGGAFTVTGEGYATAGGIFADGDAQPASDDPSLRDLLIAASGCNDAELTVREGRPAVVGDPTEGALLVAAAKAGITREAIEADMPRLRVVPFDSERKLMTVVRKRGGSPYAMVKGAPEVVVERCAHVRVGCGIEPFTHETRARMLEAAALLANDALRVLAIAERSIEGCTDGDDCERGLTFLGLVGMQDPPRSEAREAVHRCRRAGIRPVMITGDHPHTARAIARELGMLDGDDGRGGSGGVVIGSELEAMSDAELARRVEGIAVYARTTAEHKLRIVRAWKANGAIVAMTGDGVNDAPALREASIGIAMGIAGTEVTKEAADLVIADDNFASIVAAVEEGRGVYDNIRKTLAYLLAGNAGELTVMFVAAVAGWPLPLLPVHLLWINLVTDGMPALALATDPVDPQVLSRKPRSPDAEMLSRRFLARVGMTGCLSAAVTLTAFAHGLFVEGSVAIARNAAFCVLVSEELLRSFGARSHTKTLREIGILSNLKLLGIIVASFALQVALHESALLQPIFETQSMPIARYLAYAGLGAVPLCVLEALKVVRKRRLSADAVGTTSAAHRLLPHA